MSSSSKSGSKALTILIGIIVVLLVAVLAVVVTVAVVGKQQTQEQQVEVVEEDEQSAKDKILERGFVENEEQAAMIMEDMEEKVAEGMFNCRMSMDWYFADGKSQSPNAYVENASTNTYPFYFDVYVKDTGEKVYSSPIVPVGSYIYGLTLEKDLPAGDYDMEVVYTMVDDANDYEEVSAVGFSIAVEIGS